MAPGRAARAEAEAGRAPGVAQAFKRARVRVRVRDRDRRFLTRMSIVSGFEPLLALRVRVRRIVIVG